MPKGDRRQPGQPLKDGAASLRNRINAHDDDIQDAWDRIYDLEQAAKDPLITVNVCVSGQPGTMQVRGSAAQPTG